MEDLSRYTGEEKRAKALQHLKLFLRRANVFSQSCDSTSLSTINAELTQTHLETITTLQEQWKEMELHVLAYDEDDSFANGLEQAEEQLVRLGRLRVLLCQKPKQPEKAA